MRFYRLRVRVQREQLRHFQHPPLPHLHQHQRLQAASTSIGFGIRFGLTFTSVGSVIRSISGIRFTSIGFGIRFGLTFTSVGFGFTFGSVSGFSIFTGIFFSNGFLSRGFFRFRLVVPCITRELYRGSSRAYSRYTLCHRQYQSHHLHPLPCNP